MKPVCETVVKDILPAMRSIIATELQKQGLTQNQIAKKLFITQPAVSQYLKKARARNTQILSKNPQVHAILEKKAKQLAKKQVSKEELTIGLCDACRQILKTGIVCEFHRHTTKQLDKCSVCMKGH